MKGKAQTGDRVQAGFEAPGIHKDCSTSSAEGPGLSAPLQLLSCLFTRMFLIPGTQRPPVRLMLFLGTVPLPWSIACTEDNKQKAFYSVEEKVWQKSSSTQKGCEGWNKTPLRSYSGSKK